MNRDLRLQIVLDAVDKATRTLKKITTGNQALAGALKKAYEQKRKLDSVQKDVSGFQKTKAKLDQTTGALVAAREKVRAMQTAQREGEPVTAKWRREFTKANLAVRDLAATSQKQRQQLNQQRASLQAAGFNTSRFAASQADLASKLKQANAAVDQQKLKLGQLHQQQRKLQKLQAGAKQLRGAGVSLALHGAGAAYMGQALGTKALQVISPGIDYGAQMSELQAVSRLNKTDPRFTALKQQARDLGGSTAFSATEVGAGQTFLARAGFSPEAIRSSMADVLNLALANGSELARTADIASNISSAFRIDPEVEGNMRRVADVLSATASRANVDLEMLGETMKYLGQAKGLNVSLEQAATLSGLLGNIGIQGSQAGTTLRAMLNRLSAPMGPAQKALDKLNIKVADTKGNMRDITDILGDVNKATKKLGNVQQAAYLKKIFGEEAGSGMAELIRQRGTGAINDLLTQLQNAAGENARMAKVRADNLAGDIKNLQSAWEEMGITLQDSNDAPLRQFTQELTRSLSKVTQWIKQNPELAASIAKWTAIILAAVTVLGVLGFALGNAALAVSGLITVGLKLLGPIKLVGQAVLWLGRLLLMNPIGLLITAIAAGAYLIWKNWAPIKVWFSDLWTGVKSSFNSFLEETQTAWSGGFSGMLAWLANWSPLGILYKAVQPILNYFGVDLPSKFSDFGTNLVQGFIQGIQSKFTAAKQAITTIAAGAYLIWKNWEPIKARFSNLWTGVKASFNSFLEETQTAWSGGFSGMLAWLANWSPLGILYKAVQPILNYFGVDLPSKFSDFGTNLVQGFIQGIQSKFTAAKQAITDLGDSTINWFKEKLGIHSPSRIFAELGINTLQGYQQGLQHQEQPTLAKVNQITQQLIPANSEPLVTPPAPPVPVNVLDLTQRLKAKALQATPPQSQPILAKVSSITQQLISADNLPTPNAPASATPQRPLKSGNTQVSLAGDTITIHISPAPGMDERAIANQIERMFVERERRKQVSVRAHLFDNH